MVSASAQETALVLLDLQEGLCRAPREGEPPPLAAAVAERAVLPTAAAALGLARERGLVVVHVRLAFSEEHANRTNRSPRFDDHERAGRFARGSDAVTFCGEVAPEPGELILEKGSVGPFASTPLDVVLRLRGVRTLLVAGVATHLAVESTVREAADRGFEVIVLEDACAAPTAELHEHAVTQTIPAFAEVIAAGELGERLHGASA